MRVCVLDYRGHTSGAPQIKVEVGSGGVFAGDGKSEVHVTPFGVFTSGPNFHSMISRGGGHCMVMESAPQKR
jgi:hypothetical protein